MWRGFTQGKAFFAEIDGDSHHLTPRRPRWRSLTVMGTKMWHKLVVFHHPRLSLLGHPTHEH